MPQLKAILLNKTDQGVTATLTEIEEAMLPEGDVLLDIAYSTLNYKDALAITARSPVVRKYPMVPGIDFAGTVISSRSSQWRTGDQVVLNGWGVGEQHWGGLATKARVKGEWLISLPEALSLRQAMAIGTAGYTAMLSVMAIEKHGVTSTSGDVLVTGANGGVGSIAVALLSKLGYRVIASTGRLGEVEHLKRLGAAAVIDRGELSSAGKPLGKERWAAVCDSLGSFTLANACATTKYRGIVTACGLAQGMDFPASVAPFILRGVTLAGIDSVMAPVALRQEAWSRLSRDLPTDRLEAITREVGLSEVAPIAAELLAGRVRGRVVVNVAR